MKVTNWIEEKSALKTLLVFCVVSFVLGWISGCSVHACEEDKCTARYRICMENANYWAARVDCKNELKQCEEKEKRLEYPKHG